MDREAFNRGVTDALTLAPVRRWIGWHYDHLVSWHYTRRIYGTRCPDFEPECPCCRRWADHDWLFNDTEPSKET